MSAYRGGYVKELVNSPAATANSLKIAPSSIGYYEPVMAQDELVITMSGDTIQGLVSTADLKIVPA